MGGRRLSCALAGLAALALASCGGGGGDDTSTQSGEDGALAGLLKSFSDPGSAIDQFEAFDWEKNVIKEVPKRTSAPNGQAIVETGEAKGICAAQCLFLIRDNPALIGKDLEGAKAGVDAATGQPTVTLTLTSRGRRSFQELTREIAEQGSAAHPHHVALMVGDTVLSLPIIDPKQNPHGIDSSTVQITGGFTATDAQALARALNPS